MTYTSTKRIMDIAGVGVEIVNETIGTGDSAEADFELDQGNVITGTYTLKYAAASGATNTFTTLTDVTDYVLSLDGGTIVLTAAGITALGTNVLYGDYTYSPKISDTMLTTYLAQIDEEVDAKTGNYWGSVKSGFTLFSGERDDYPSTDEPFARDYEDPDSYQIPYKSVQTVDAVYFLNQGAPLGSVQSYDSTGATYADNTTEANSPAGTAFQPFGATTAANDYLYIGMAYQFLSVSTLMFIVGVTAGTNTMEYWNGTAWTSFTPTESTTGVLNFEATGKLTWSNLSSWSKTTVNSSASLYFVRVVANSTYSTEAEVTSITPDQTLAIQTNVPLYQVTFDSNGEVVLQSHVAPNGINNVRINYTHGYSTTPDLLIELATLYGAIMIFSNITGGSYDDATMFTLGRKTVSIGEVYVNSREAVRQFEVRAQQIIDALGKKMDVA